MTLISILIGLLIESLVGDMQDFRRHERVYDYVEWLRARLRGVLWEGPLGLLLVLGLPLLTTGLVQHWLENAWFGLLELAFSVGVLLFCLGPRDLNHDLASYRVALRNGDADSAARYAALSLGGVEAPEGADAQARAVVDAGFVQTNVRIFGVLFWFIVLGPAGAVLYRFTALLWDQYGRGGDAFADSLGRVYALLDWPSAHLSAMGFALSGHFDGALARWRALPQSGLFSDRADTVLVAIGWGALGYRDPDHQDVDWDRALEDQIALIRRTLVVWVAVVALLTLVDWVS